MTRRKDKRLRRKSVSWSGNGRNEVTHPLAPLQLIKQEVSEEGSVTGRESELQTPVLAPIPFSLSEAQEKEEHQSQSRVSKTPLVKGKEIVAVEAEETGESNQGGINLPSILQRLQGPKTFTDFPFHQFPISYQERKQFRLSWELVRSLTLFLQSSWTEQTLAMQEHHHRVVYTGIGEVTLQQLHGVLRSRSTTYMQKGNWTEQHSFVLLAEHLAGGALDLYTEFSPLLLSPLDAPDMDEDTEELVPAFAHPLRAGVVQAGAGPGPGPGAGHAAQGPRVGWQYSSESLPAFHNIAQAPVGRMALVGFTTPDGTHANHRVLFAQVAVVAHSGGPGPAGTPEVEIPLRTNGRAKSPVRAMFKLFRANFPPNTPEKIAQISRFERKTDETLRNMFSRFQQLRRDTGFLPDSLQAAHTFLHALPPALVEHTRRRLQDLGTVDFTPEDVFHMACQDEYLMQVFEAHKPAHVRLREQQQQAWRRSQRHLPQSSVPRSYDLAPNNKRFSLTPDQVLAKMALADEDLPAQPAWLEEDELTADEYAMAEEITMAQAGITSGLEVCTSCGKQGHLKVACPVYRNVMNNKRVQRAAQRAHDARAQATTTEAGPSRPPGSPAVQTAELTPCIHCGKLHKGPPEECWTKYPEKMPQWLKDMRARKSGRERIAYLATLWEQAGLDLSADMEDNELGTAAQNVTVEPESWEPAYFAQGTPEWDSSSDSGSESVLQLHALTADSDRRLRSSTRKGEPNTKERLPLSYQVIPLLVESQVNQNQVPATGPEPANQPGSTLQFPLMHNLTSTPPGSGFGEARRILRDDHHGTSGDPPEVSSHPSVPQATQPSPDFIGQLLAMPLVPLEALNLVIPALPSPEAQLLMTRAKVSLVDLGVTSLPGLSPTVQPAQAATVATSTPTGSSVRCNVAISDNAAGKVLIGGQAPATITWDSGAQPLLVGKSFGDKLLATGVCLRTSNIRIKTASGAREGIRGISREPLSITLLPQSGAPTTIHTRCLFTDATTYDVLAGTEVMFPLKADLLFSRSVIQWQDPKGESQQLPLQLVSDSLASAHHTTLELGEELTACSAEYAEAVSDQGWSMESCTTTPEGVANQTTRVPIPTEGVVVLDLFSGLSTGLAALLQAGYHIKRYYACDSSSMARTAASHHLELLHAKYPCQLPRTSFAGAHKAIPQNVELLSGSILSALGPIHFVLGGWPCQGLSRAGLGGGLEDSRS